LTDLLAERAGDARIAVLRRILRTRAFERDLAGYRRRFTDVTAVIVPHQIDVNMIVMIDIGARRQHGGELLARG
jgi:hypothetical protein